MNIEWEILSKVIKNKASDSDIRRFEEWYSGSKEQDKLIKDMHSFYNESKEIKYVSEENINKEWKKLVRKVKPIRLVSYYILRIAASVVIVCGLALSYLYIYKDFLSPEVIMESISQGEKQAVLVLSDGSRHDLSVDKEEMIKSDGVLIKNKDKTLTFESKFVDKSGKLNPDEIKYNKISVPRLGEYNLTLADGTKVWLNAMSSLKFPNSFVGNTRHVIVEGEAYFEVAHKHDKPFIVSCNSINVKVLGTKFNIRSYNKKEIAATLVEGKVQMNYTNSPDLKVILKPGEQGVAKEGVQGIKVNKVNLASIVAWKSGEFVFENSRLEDIMKELSMWYDIEVIYEDSSIKNERFYVYISRSDDFKKVLKKFEITKKLKIRVKGKNVIISKR